MRLLPQTPIWHQVESTYCHHGADTDFTIETSLWQDYVRLSSRRSIQLLPLDELDQGITVTCWQWSSVPKPDQNCVVLIHEGVNTSSIPP